MFGFDGLSLKDPHCNGILLFENLTYLILSGVIDISIDNDAWLSVRGSSHQCTVDSPSIVVRFCEDLVTSCVLQ